jgi:oxygen-independent coproporphyrinogen III oxidase
MVHLRDMAGLYIHIPFCRKICSYCDFYKTTQSSYLPDFLRALDHELNERVSYLAGEKLETVYLGGGTPSLIPVGQLEKLFMAIERNHPLTSDCEITLEANPDDLRAGYLQDLHNHTPINRLSIGIQSFHEGDLKLLNRRHTAQQAVECVDQARHAGFGNITVDLIYGLPDMNSQSWQENLDIVFSLGVQHLSAYHLTIEPNTALARMKSRGLVNLPGDDQSSEQFILLHKTALEHDFMHYEISNLAREGFMSQHNCNYWKQKKYLGLGPSAHSYDLVSRQWNISNIHQYIACIADGKPYAESERLDLKTKYNEYLMLSLRTVWGIKADVIRDEFGASYVTILEENLRTMLSPDWFIRQGSSIRLTPAGWMVSDYIVSRLMMA